MVLLLIRLRRKLPGCKPRQVGYIPSLFTLSTLFSKAFITALPLYGPPIHLCLHQHVVCADIGVVKNNITLYESAIQCILCVVKVIAVQVVV